MPHRQTPPDRPRLPAGWRRFLARMPIPLFRCGLGWVFGGRLLLLHHVGRVTGLDRRVVLEVVEYAPDTGSWTVASGFGPKAAWYRNLRAEPKILIEVGRRRHAVTARFLTPDDGAEIMARYARRHPRTACARSWASCRTAPTPGSGRPAGPSPSYAWTPAREPGCREARTPRGFNSRPRPPQSPGDQILHCAKLVLGGQSAVGVAQRPGVIGTLSGVGATCQPPTGLPPAGSRGCARSALPPPIRAIRCGPLDEPGRGESKGRGSVVAEDPGQGGTSDDGGGVPPIADTVWRRFLGDTEQAIRASAPRELSAWERAAGSRPDPVDSHGVQKEPQGGAPVEPRPASFDAVGEVWQPDEQRPGPAWRDLDGPARWRRVGRTLATVAALLVAAGALSHASSRPDVPDGTPTGATSQQSEEVLPDGAPTATAPPPAPAYAGTPPPRPRTG
jgi:deazaflavin-dependent oxidoreductase (nitroreductase family)